MNRERENYRQTAKAWLVEQRRRIDNGEDIDTSTLKEFEDLRAEVDRLTELRAAEKRLQHVQVMGPEDENAALLDQATYLRERWDTASAITSEKRDAAARALAQLKPGEDWPTNAALGGSMTGTRDDEFRSAIYDQTDAVLAALGLTVAGDAS